MKALVTGSTGFIGSHLVEALIHEEHDVFCLVRSESNTLWLKEQNVTLVAGDYDDPSSLNRAVSGMDVVFHVGACIQAPDWDTYFCANTTCTANLLQACVEADPKLKRFVFVSSISAGGPSESGILKKESDTDRPVNLYGRSKLLAEEAVHKYKDQLPVVIIRPPNVLGSRQNELTFVLQLLKKRIIPLIGSRSRRTSIIFVRDLVRAMILIAVDDRAVGNTYYVTDNHTYTWRHMLMCLARVLGVTPWVLKIPYPALYSIAAVLEGISKILGTQPAVNRESLRMTRKYDWIYDSGKIQEELGFRPNVRFEEDIRQIVHDCREQGVI
jgi:nucleoside-diphosphate-sugar epimerase